MSRIPRPLNAKGATTMRWQAWRRKQAVQASRRSYGACQAPDCNSTAVEAHHTFARRQVVSEPLASHKELLAAVCRRCHNVATVDPAGEVAEALRLLALERAEGRWKVQTKGRDTYGRARAIEDALRASGEWDALCDEAGR